MEMFEESVLMKVPKDVNVYFSDFKKDNDGALERWIDNYNIVSLWAYNAAISSVIHENSPLKTCFFDKITSSASLHAGPK